MEILRVEHLHKYYGGRGNVTKAVDDISFSVQKGEFLGVMGASGSGKTTLLNCISTIDTATSGGIFVGDQDITRMRGKKLAAFRRSQLGFVFQDFNLLDTLTARENVALALTILRTPAREIDVRVQNVAAELGIAEVLEKYPYQLSGGQKQRVACARAIVTNPQLVLADEPTGALDSKSARMLLHLSLIHICTPGELKARYGRDKLYLSPRDAGALEGVLRQMGLAYTKPRRRYHLALGSTLEAIPILERCRDLLDGAELIGGTMDDVFLQIIEGGERPC